MSPDRFTHFLLLARKNPYPHPARLQRGPYHASINARMRPNPRQDNSPKSPCEPVALGRVSRPGGPARSVEGRRGGSRDRDPGARWAPRMKPITVPAVDKFFLFLHQPPTLGDRPGPDPDLLRMAPLPRPSPETPGQGSPAHPGLRGPLSVEAVTGPIRGRPQPSGSWDVEVLHQDPRPLGINVPRPSWHHLRLGPLDSWFHATPWRY